MKKVINGINVKEFVNGWWGEHGEGVELLRSLGLSPKSIPFSIEGLLVNGSSDFADSDGSVISVKLARYDTYYDFSCVYHGKRKTLRLYREWGSENLDVILRLESHSLGDCLRQVILGKSII